MKKHLYKRRLDGKMQRTTVHAEEITGRYRTITCQCQWEDRYTSCGITQVLDVIRSSEIISEWTCPEPKNVGKKNETNVREQGLAEVKAKITKMLDSGYVEDIKNVDNPRVKKIAMLAKPADLERVEKEIYKNKLGLVFIQPKLDGVRCIATSQGLFTRSGKRITGMDHIEAELKPVFSIKPYIILDGELYNHELKDNFDEIISAVRKEVNLDSEQASKIHYHVYDLVDDNGDFDPISFYNRCETMDNSIWSYHDFDFIKEVLTYKRGSVDGILSQHEKWLKEGYEGTMIRYDAPYQLNKRNWNLQKLKEFQDDEFIIKEIKEGRGKNEGLASVVVVDVDGVEASPTMMGSLEFRKQLWEDREDYVGGVATVKYFNKTKDGSLRFPNCKMVYKKERDL